MTAPDPVDAAVLDHLTRAQMAFRAMLDSADRSRSAEYTLSHMFAVANAFFLDRLQTLDPAAAAEALAELEDILADGTGTGPWVYNQLVQRGAVVEDIVFVEPAPLAAPAT